MKQEILDRLIIDRALDGLAPDVVALLDAYLEAEPDRMQAAEEIGETVRLARLACPPPPAMSLPPLKFLPLPEKTPAAMYSQRAWWPAELAAAVVLGVGLAFWALRPSEPAASRPEANTVFARPEGIDSAPAFWSVKRLASMESRTVSPQAQRLTWRSLVQNPQMND